MRTQDAGRGQGTGAILGNIITLWIRSSIARILDQYLAQQWYSAGARGRGGSHKMRALLLIACWSVLASGVAAVETDAGEAHIDSHIECLWTAEQP